MIITVRNIITNHEESYALRKLEDFDVIFDHYPWALDVALAADSIQDAAVKIAHYLDRGSRVSVRIHDDVNKHEDDIKFDEKPKNVKLNLRPTSDLKDTFTLWAEKRLEQKRGIPRDSSFTPDPGRVRDKELDEQGPVTAMDKVKARIKEGKREDR